MILPKTRQLEYLVALVEEQHFARAAERCHVSQPAFSEGIGSLEHLLGLKVAERNKRTVIITADGHALARRAAEILRGAENFINYSKCRAGTFKGDLRLGTIPTVGPFILPRALKAILSGYPDLRLLIREETSDALLDKLHSGQLDLLLIAAPFPMENVEFSAVIKDGYQLACPPDHRLANKTQVTASGLFNERILLLEPAHCLHEHALSAMGGLSGQFSLEYEATSLPTLLAMVMEGIGITAIPELAIQAGLTGGYDISLVPIVNAESREIIMVWRKDSVFATISRELAELITTAIKM